MQKISNPTPIFLDASGNLMDGGHLYIGTANADPEVSPLTVYWDSAATQPVSQPVSIQGGMIVNGATPAFLYINASDWSVRTRDSNGVQVTYSASNFISGVNYQPLDADLTTIAGQANAAYGLALLEADGTDPFVTEDGTETLTNKTLTSPILNTAAIKGDSTVDDNGTLSPHCVGFRGLPLSAQTQDALITLALTDSGKRVANTTGGWTIPANASVAFPVDTVIVLYNDSGSTQTVAITTDTLRLHGSSTTGTRTVAIRGFCTLIKVNSTEWVATGDVS